MGILCVGWLNETKKLESTIKNMYRCQHIRVMHDNHQFELGISSLGYEWSRLFTAIAQRKQMLGLTKDDIYILVVDQPDEWNWFSAWPLDCLDIPYGGPTYLDGFSNEMDLNIGFVHADGWKTFGFQAEHAVLYQIFRLYLVIQMFQATIRREMVGPNDFIATAKRVRHRFSHDAPRGCINDMCDYKPDIQHKIKSADVCRDCLGLLDDSQYSTEYISDVVQIFQKVRELVINVKDYLDEVEESSSEAALSYPAILASMKMQWENVRQFADPHAKIWNAVGYFDYIIKYTCILLYTEQGVEWPDKTRPSLGDWVSRFQKMTHKDFGLSEVNRTRLKKTFQILNRLTINDRVQNIVQYRNDNVGHGVLIGLDYNFQQEAESLGSAIQQMEELLFPIWTSRQLFHPNGGLASEGTSLSVQGYRLNGNLTIFPLKEYSIPLDQMATMLPLIQKMSGEEEQYRIIMLDEGENVFNLHDHIRYRKCNVCNQRRLTMKDGEFWLDVVKGHRIRKN